VGCCRSNCGLAIFFRLLVLYVKRQLRIFAANNFDISVLVLGLLLNDYIHIVTERLDCLLYVRGKMELWSDRNKK